MLGTFKRIYRAGRIRMENERCAAQQPEAVPIPVGIAQVRQQMADSFGGSSDLVFRPLRGGALLLVYLEGMVDRTLLSADVIRPLVLDTVGVPPEDFKNIDTLEEKLLTTGEVARVDDFGLCKADVLQGKALLFVDTVATALSIGLQKWNKRAIEEPKTDGVVRGPREGFTESIQDNIVLIRRRIQNGNLIFENLCLGRLTRTRVSFCYLRGVANQSVIDEVRKRLNHIYVDSIMGSGSIEELIEDAPFSIFPTVAHSERPDTVAGKLLEGRVAILCDGSPFVLTVPNLFVEYLQTSEDYYRRWMYTPLIRLVRLLAFLMAVATPGFYVTLTCFHQDVVPFDLLLTIASASEGVSFPPTVECFILILIFELIREGGIRMPKSLGQAISIVGALIIGQAAVQAGIVSSPAVIVIAATAICTFIISNLDDTVLIMRIALLITSSCIGFLGLMLGLFAFFTEMCAIHSFGVPYLAPIAPHFGQDMKDDTFIRMPLWYILRRGPDSIEQAEKPSGKVQS